MTKTCSKCGIEKSRDAFYKRSASPDGLMPLCKDCRKVYRKAQYAEDPSSAKQAAKEWKQENPDKVKASRAKKPPKPPKVKPPSTGYRKCNKCGTSKPETTEYFTRHNMSPGGLLSTCKECKRAAEKIKRDADPEKYRAQSRESYNRNKKARNARRKAKYAENPEPVRAQVRAYRARNLEKRRAEDRAYHAKNRNRRLDYFHTWRERGDNGNKARERSRTWLRNNPERRRVQGQVKRARKRSVPGTFTHEDTRQMFLDQEGLCYYCDAELWITGFQIDHKNPLSRPETNPTNSPENLCLACPKCNGCKKDKTEAEFRVYLQKRTV